METLTMQDWGWAMWSQVLGKGEDGKGSTRAQVEDVAFGSERPGLRCDLTEGLLQLAVGLCLVLRRSFIEKAQ